MSVTTLSMLTKCILFTRGRSLHNRTRIFQFSREGGSTPCKIAIVIELELDDKDFVNLHCDTKGLCQELCLVQGHVNTS